MQLAVLFQDTDRIIEAALLRECGRRIVRDVFMRDRLEPEALGQLREVRVDHRPSRAAGLRGKT